MDFNYQFIPMSYLPWLKKYNKFYHAQFRLLQSIFAVPINFSFHETAALLLSNDWIMKSLWPSDAHMRH